MSVTRRQIIIATWAISILIAFAVGWGLRGAAETPRVKGGPDLVDLVAHLQPGDTLTMTETRKSGGAYARGETETGASRQIAASDKGAYARGLSWWGLGGPEAASQHQGMKIADGEFTGGSHRGTGILERWWSWLKSVFWVAAFGLVALLVLSFIPATRGVATAILRGAAAIVPIVGSTVEATISRFTAVKPLEQVVDGGEEFKDAVAKLPQRLATEPGEAYTVGQKAEIKRLFQDAHGEAQKGNTPTIVKAITG